LLACLNLPVGSTPAANKQLTRLVVLQQVHAAVLRGSNKEVVLKVLKPGTEDTLVTDLNFVSGGWGICGVQCMLEACATAEPPIA
jgi:hypothetical protein